MKLQDKIAELGLKHKKIAFIVNTPGSSKGDPVQAVMLKDFKVRETGDEHFIVIGRDLEEERRKDLETGFVPTPRKHRPKSHKVFRSYRLDRIIPRTIVAG